MMMWLLRKLMPAGDFDAAMGDLAEEYAFRRGEATLASATLWYWSQIVRSVLPVSWAWAQRTSALITLATALGAFVVANLLEGSLLTLVSRVMTIPDGLRFVTALLIGVGSLFVASYVATAYREGAAHALAGIVVIAVATLMIFVGDTAPRWYQFSFLVAGPTACVAARLLRRRRARQSIGQREV